MIPNRWHFPALAVLGDGLVEPRKAQSQNRCQFGLCVWLVVRRCYFRTGGKSVQLPCATSAAMPILPTSDAQFACAQGATAAFIHEMTASLATRGESRWPPETSRYLFFGLAGSLSK